MSSKRSRPTSALSQATIAALVADPAAALVHSVPHPVVSQILRPCVAAFIPPRCVALRRLEDAQCCVTALAMAPAAACIEATAHLPRLTAVDLSDQTVDAALIAALVALDCDPRRVCRLQRLNLSECEVVDAACLAQVARLSQLQSLDMTHCWCYPAELACVTALRHLRRLVLRWCVSGDSLLGPLSRRLQLDDLDVSTCQVTPRNVKFIAAMPLTRLNLSECTEVDAECLAAVSLMPHLTALSLRGSQGAVPKVDTRGLASLAALRQLKSLDLRHNDRLAADGLAEVGKLRQLRRLNISECNGVDSAGLAHLAGMRLTALNLAQCPGANAAGLRHVATLTQLRRLDLGNCSALDGCSIAVVASLPLFSLTLRALDLSPEDAANVARLSQLRELDLRGRVMKNSTPQIFMQSQRETASFYVEITQKLFFSREIA